MRKYVDKKENMEYNSNCRYELNRNNNFNSKSLPSKLVRLIINKIDT